MYYIRELTRRSKRGEPYLRGGGFKSLVHKKTYETKHKKKNYFKNPDKRYFSTNNVTLCY